MNKHKKMIWDFKQNTCINLNDIKQIDILPHLSEVGRKDDVTGLVANDYAIVANTKLVLADGFVDKLLAVEWVENNINTVIED